MIPIRVARRHPVVSGRRRGVSSALVAAGLMLALSAAGCNDGPLPQAATTKSTPDSAEVLDLADAQETCASVLTADMTAIHVPAEEGYEFLPHRITDDGRIIGTQSKYGDTENETGLPVTVRGLYQFDPGSGALSSLHEGLVDYYDIHVNETGIAWMSPQPDGEHVDVWFRPWQTGGSLRVGTFANTHDQILGQNLGMSEDYVAWSFLVGTHGEERTIDTHVYSIEGHRVVAELVNAERPAWIGKTMYVKVPDESDPDRKKTLVATWTEEDGLEITEAPSQRRGQFITVADHQVMTQITGDFTAAAVVADRDGQNLVRWDTPMTMTGVLEQTRELVLWWSNKVTMAGAAGGGYIWSYNLRTGALQRCDQPAGLAWMGGLGDDWMIYRRGEPTENNFELYRLS